MGPCLLRAQTLGNRVGHADKKVRTPAVAKRGEAAELVAATKAWERGPLARHCRAHEPYRPGLSDDWISRPCQQQRTEVGASLGDSADLGAYTSGVG
jgi:hypothetical protein